MSIWDDDFDSSGIVDTSQTEQILNLLERQQPPPTATITTTNYTKYVSFRFFVCVRLFSRLWLNFAESIRVRVCVLVQLFMWPFLFGRVSHYSLACVRTFRSFLRFSVHFLEIRFFFHPHPSMCMSSTAISCSCFCRFCCYLALCGIRLLWSFSPHRLIGCLIISKHILCWLR